MTETPFSQAPTLHDGPVGIDVAQAESDFHQLERSLSRYQHETRGITSQDIEKAEDEKSGEQFDLREYLSSSNDANQQAGIKHKHVGVTWEDLEVRGVGGEGIKVRVIVLSSSARVKYSPGIRRHLSRYTQIHYFGTAF